MLPSASLCLKRDGAQLAAGAAAGSLDAIVAALADVPPDRPGLRLAGLTSLSAHLAANGAIGGVAASVRGQALRPVRAVLFDKSAANNWALGWHQDRTIAVAERIDVTGFGPWTVKRGIVHVAPPFALLAEMVTLRIHLDPVPADNAPLLIAPGSHRRLIREPDIADEVAACGSHVCVAEAGDIWAYATPILHASDAAVRPKRRRVLQVDYAAGALPGGLRWYGV